MLTRYGTDVLISVAITVIVLSALAIWTDERWARLLLFAIAGCLVIFSLNFFRDPDRSPATGGKPLDDLIISPADGKIDTTSPTVGGAVGLEKSGVGTAKCGIGLTSKEGKLAVSGNGTTSGKLNVACNELSK